MLSRKRTDEEELEAEIERRLRALEEPEFIEVHLAFDPSPLRQSVESRLAMAGTFLPVADVPPVEKRIGDDGEPFWVLKVVIA